MANYNYITKYSSPNFTKGRTKDITTLIIHWWNDPAKNPKVSGVVSWLCNVDSNVSAHYVITGTNREVYHLVDNKDTAWHAKNANPFSLGLELDPRQRDEDYDVAAEVIANIWKHYGKKFPLEPHNKYVKDSRCPGTYDLSRLQREAEAKMGKDTTQPVKPSPAPSKPAPAPTNAFLGARGYLTKGDVGENIRQVNLFFRNTFPAYAPVKILGNQFGPITRSTVMEFQRRAKVGGGVDGNIGPLTYQAMKNHGFKG